MMWRLLYTGYVVDNISKTICSAKLYCFLELILQLHKTTIEIRLNNTLLVDRVKISYVKDNLDSSLR